MNTLFIGRKLIRLKSVGSTNNFAASLPLSDAPEGTVIWADEQFEGRGQLGRTWHAAAGMNLTFTLVLRPSFLHPSEIFYLNKCIALALKQALETFSSEAKIEIKWPNDIFANGRKLSGILTENVVRGGQIVSYLAGIGININQVEFPSSAGNPISLAELTGHPLDLEVVLTHLCSFLEANYLKLRNQGKDSIQATYREALRGWNQVVEGKQNQQINRFILRDVDAQGRILLEDATGEIQAFSHGALDLSYPDRL